MGDVLKGCTGGGTLLLWQNTIREINPPSVLLSFLFSLGAKTILQRGPTKLGTKNMG